MSARLSPIILVSKPILTCRDRFAALANFYPASTYSSYNFFGSAWLIPVVMLGYSVVIILDNLLVWHTNKTISSQTSNARNDSHVGEGYKQTPQSESSEGEHGRAHDLEGQTRNEHD